MKPLPTNQRVLTWLCLLPASANTSNLVKFGYILLTILCIVNITANLAASTVFFMKAVSTEFEKSLFALFQISGGIGVWWMFISVFPLRRNIQGIFEKLSEIYDESMSFVLFKIKKIKCKKGFLLI